MAATSNAPVTHQDLAMLKLAPEPFSRTGWIFELKYDGFRVLAGYSQGRPQLISRLGTDLLQFFPEIGRELQLLGDKAPIMLDGELVILDSKERPQRDRLRRRPSIKRAENIEHASRTEPAVLAVYDLLVVGGEDVRAKPLIERKVLLNESLADTTTRIFTVAHHEESSEALCKLAEAQKMEGIAAKSAQSSYRGGYASGWLKIRTSHGRAADAERRKWSPSAVR